jgi:hypothetical protein
MTGLARFSLLAILICLGSAFAQISPGYDLLQTGSGASVDLSSRGLGVVPLAGVPIQTGTGTTDTMIYRSQTIPATGGSSTTSVYALLMKSTQTVTVNGQTADVWVTLNNSGGSISQSVVPQPDSLSASSGSVSVRSDGTFDSSMSVNADVIFVRAGGNPSNTSDVISHSAAPSISLASTNSTWSSSGASGYPNSSTYPSGGFKPIVIHHTGPHPVIPSTCGNGAQPAAVRNGSRAVGTAYQLVQACISQTTLQ